MKPSEPLNKKGLTDMTTGSPMRHMIKFSVPLLIGNLFQQFYNITDSIIVGNTIGTNAQAAVNNGMPVLFLTIALFSGLGMGVSIILSQNYGAKQMATVRKAIKTIYSTLLIAAIPLTLLGIFITPHMLSLLGVPEEGGVREMAATYISLVFVGTLGSLGFNFNAGILQGLGDSKTPLRFLIISSVLNVLLDLLFIIVFQMGIAGVAVATIIAQTFSWLYGVYYIKKKYPELDMSLFRLSIDFDILKKIIHLGIPAAIQQSLFSLGMLAIQRLVNEGGPNFVAGAGNAHRIDAFIFLPMLSFSAALTTFTGQNIGAAKIDRVSKGLRITIFAALAVFIVVGTLTLFFGRFLLGLFNPDEAVIDYGMRYLYSVVPFMFMIVIQFMLNSVMRGAGQVMIPVFTTIAGFILIRVPSAYLLALHLGHEYIFFSYAIGWVFSLSFSIIIYLTGRWKSKSVVAAR